MTTLKERLIKIGAKVVSHGRYVAFQMAVAISRHLFRDILRLGTASAARSGASVKCSIVSRSRPTDGRGASR